MGNEINRNIQKMALGLIAELNGSHGFCISLDRALCAMDALKACDMFDEGDMEGTLMSALCRSREEQEMFPSAFRCHFSKMRKLTMHSIEQKDMEDEAMRLRQAEEKLKEDIRRQEEEFEERLSQNACSADEQELSELRAMLPESCQCREMVLSIIRKDMGTILGICQMDDGGKGMLPQIQSAMQDLMINAIERGAGENAQQAILDAMELLSASISEHRKMKETGEAGLARIGMLIKKQESRMHRDEYTEGRNAVQTQHGYMYKDFSQVGEEDLEKICGHIRRNALTIRTRIQRAQKAKESTKLDAKRTMKAAAKTGMCPMELFHKRQRKARMKIVCITDVSGSCRSASQVLLTFMYSLQEAFPGGVESYVFVKQLADATDAFRSCPLREARTVASGLVERDYSDYGAALRQFSEQFIDRVTKDTVVIYLGDARNNRNDTGEGCIEEVRRKAAAGKGKLMWLNPEPRHKWGTGDSVMNEYAKHMDFVMQASNASGLMECMDVLMDI